MLQQMTVKAYGPTTAYANKPMFVYAVNAPVFADNDTDFGKGGRYIGRILQYG